MYELTGLKTIVEQIYELEQPPCAPVHQGPSPGEQLLPIIAIGLIIVSIAVILDR